MVLFAVGGFHCNAFNADSLVWDDALCGLAFFPLEELGRLEPAVWGRTFWWRNSIRRWWFSGQSGVIWTKTVVFTSRLSVESNSHLFWFHIPTTLVLHYRDKRWALNFLIQSEIKSKLVMARLEQFSIECCKTKAKVIPLANKKEHKQSSEPIRTLHKDMSLTRSAGKCARARQVWIWFYFWLAEIVADCSTNHFFDWPE